MIAMTPNTHHSVIDFDLVLNASTSFDASELDRLLAHETFNTPVTPEHGVAFTIALFRRIDIISEDLMFVADDLDFSEINLCELLACLDEYIDYDDSDHRCEVFARLSELCMIDLYDIETVANFYDCKRR